MTVETTARKQVFPGGQSTLTFSFRTDVNHPEYVKITNLLISTGAESELEYATDYTAVINSNGIGGVVTISPTFSTAYSHTVYRSTTAKQESDYDDYNQFPADTLEGDFDKVVMKIQELEEDSERTLKYSISATGSTLTLPVPEADTFIAWNSTATALENKEIPDPSTLVKATTAEAQAGVEDSHYMTAAKTADAITALSTVLTKATSAEASAGTESTHYMTPSTTTIALMSMVYPVGSIYMNTTYSTNPGTLLGFGTWTALGAGRVLVGYSSGDPDFGTIGATGGEKTHLLTAPETALVPHTHTVVVSLGGSGSAGVDYPDTSGADGDDSLTTNTVTATSASTAHNNLQPYIVVYMWQRTA